MLRKGCRRGGIISRRLVQDMLLGWNFLPLGIIVRHEGIALRPLGIIMRHEGIAFRPLEISVRHKGIALRPL